MARQRQRRSRGGLRPPELRGTLGTLLRTTLAQAGSLREALERGAREGKNRLDAARDAARSSRRRHDALADLGEIILELIREGEIDLDELPEVRNIVADLDELDAQDLHDRDDEPRSRPRARFDARRTTTELPRPNNEEADGTVNSTTWSPPNRPKQQRVWRPPVDDSARDRQTKVTARERPVPKPGEKPRKGGISFDDSDDDLAEFMHPDDVPPKGSTDGDS